MDQFRMGKILARRYRNRRIGSFLKEIDLSEKQSTGISKIIKSLKQNGSPSPEFETNDRRDYLITTIHIHEKFITIDKRSTDSDVVHDKDEKTTKTPIKKTTKIPIKKAGFNLVYKSPRLIWLV